MSGVQELLIRQGLEESAAVKLRLLAAAAQPLAAGAQHLVSCLRNGGKVLLCGNGGSAADAQHLAAELVGRFKMERRALPSMALPVNASTITAIGNDYGYEYVFARQVAAFGHEGDVLVAISTSGTSPNVVRAVEAARERGMVSLGLTGASGGALLSLCDVTIAVPSEDVARIQEAHITVGHIWCEIVERALFG